MGKGDTPRPLSVPKYEFDAAWARTFGGIGKSAMVERSAVAYARDVLGADVTEWQAEILERDTPTGSARNGAVSRTSVFIQGETT